MQTLYKIELFDRAFNYVSHSPIIEPGITFDYLTLEPTSVTTLLINISKGLFAHITNGKNEVVYQGIVEDYKEEAATLNLSISPLLRLCDFNAAVDTALFDTLTLEQFIAKGITDTYITNTDALQNIAGLSVKTTSATNGALVFDKSIMPFWGVCTAALQTYDVAVSCVFYPQTKSIEFGIGKISGENYIEADLKNCIDKKITIGDYYGTLNKIIFTNEENFAQQAIYYLHTDDSISSIDTNRVTPVFFDVILLRARNFEEEAAKTANEKLAKVKFNNLIELTFKYDDKLVEAGEQQIGSIHTIISSGTVYRSILTGYERVGNICKLIFGNIRLDITKKMTLERRGGGAN